MGMDIVFSAQSLINAYQKTCKNTRWKESTQRFGINLLKEIQKIQSDWKDGTFKFSNTTDFIIHERGHIRYIKAHSVYDRVVMVSFMDNVLIPKIRPHLIYDNGASLKGKGISFSRKRFSVHLNRTWMKHKENGYIRMFDFSKFFDNIPHDDALKMFRKHLDDDEYKFLVYVFKGFETDLSFLSDEEFKSVKNGLYNSIEYIGRKSNKGEKILRKGVGIGNPISQIIGLFYPNDLDNMCKTVLGIKEYGRYADDFYIMGTLDEVNAWTTAIEEKCKELKLFINRKKVRTYKITRPFIFLKTVYQVKSNGRIIKRIDKSAERRERKRIVKYAHGILSGRFDRRNVDNWYASWIGSYKKLDGRYTMNKMNAFYTKNMNMRCNNVENRTI